MQFLYNFSITLLNLAFNILALFNSKAKKGLIGRKNWEEKLKNTITPDSDWIWMHCSSLGEFEQGRPVFEALKQKYPNYKFALSFFSPSGYEIRKNYKEADLVFYLPFDTPSNAKKLAQILQPKLLILAKYDYWYNHLKYQFNNGTKIIVISAIFRENQIYFKPYGKWFANQLNKYIHRFFVQDKNSELLLNNIGIKQVTIAGDTRFDRVKSIASQTEKLDWVEQFKQNNNLIVLGSSWKEDEDLWIKFINEKLPNDYKIILVPHEIKAQKIQELKNSIKKNTTLFSELNEKDFTNSKVLIVDAIGFLSKIYASADLAYVGGGFNKSGVHNTLEPAVFGSPVIIGPNYQKFNEVKMLKKEGTLFSISNYNEFEKILIELINNPDKRDLIKSKNKSIFEVQLPSTQIILEQTEL